MLAIFVVVLAGFFAVATAHAELVSNQRDLDVLRNEITTSRASNAVLQRKVDEASSPEAIVTRAEELGMVRAEEPVYLIADGPVREPTVPVLMQPPPPEEEIMVAAARTAAESSSNDVETSAFAGSRAVSVGVEAE